MKILPPVICAVCEPMKVEHVYVYQQSKFFLYVSVNISENQKQKSTLYGASIANQTF
jgi:hypothetical protein